MRELLERLLENSYELRDTYTWKRGVPKYKIEMDLLDKDISEAEEMLKNADGENLDKNKTYLTIGLGDSQLVQTAEVKKSDTLGMWESIRERFICPKCKTEEITDSCSYCPNCGVKINFIG